MKPRSRDVRRVIVNTVCGVAVASFATWGCGEGSSTEAGGVELIAHEYQAGGAPQRQGTEPEVFNSDRPFRQAWDELNITHEPPGIDFAQDLAAIVPLESVDCGIELSRIIPRDDEIELHYDVYTGDCTTGVSKEFDIYRLARQRWPRPPEFSLRFKKVEISPLPRDVD